MLLLQLVQASNKSRRVEAHLKQFVDCYLGA
jgi:hypothetical protein